MLRTVFCYGYVALTLIFLVPIMFYMKSIRKTTPELEFARKASKIARKWARSLIKVSGVKMTVSGIENVPAGGPVLFAANHQSDFDILVFLAYTPLPVGFVAKIEMLKVPLLRTWIGLIGSVFLDRKDIRQGAKTILEGIKKLKDGHSLVLFPEGTRSKSENMLPFKAGGFKLATKSQVPVVPVTISGSYKVMEGGTINPADVSMTFHPPMYTEGLDPESLAALPKQVEDEIRKGLVV
jgi:1-acyl-sn-glycerol-3-phosphate acyltransferase